MSQLDCDHAGTANSQRIESLPLGLKSTILSFDVPHMDAEDLALYSATYDFNAKPKGGLCSGRLGQQHLQAHLLQ